MLRETYRRLLFTLKNSLRGYFVIPSHVASPHPTHGQFSHVSAQVVLYTGAVDVYVTVCSQTLSSCPLSLSLKHTHVHIQEPLLRRSIPGRHITVWQIPVSPWKPSIRSGIVVPRQLHCTLSIGAARGSAPLGH